MKKKKIDITTDIALVFSAVMLILFTITMIVIFCLYQTVPDSLIVAFFGAFGLESGYCAFIHKTKKDALIMAAKKTALPAGEVVPDIPDDNDLVIDLEG